VELTDEPTTVEFPVAGISSGRDGSTNGPASDRAQKALWFRRRGLIAAAFVVVVASGFGATLYLGVLDDVPLLNPAVAAAAEAAGVLALVGSWLRRDRHWLSRQLPLLLTTVTLAVVGTAGALWITETVTDPYPPSFGLWVGSALAALVGGPSVMRRRRSGRAATARRLAAVAAVPLTLAGGLMLIDDEYGIWPQVSDVLGHTNVIDGAGLSKLLPGIGNGAKPPAPTHGSSLPAKGVMVGLDAPSPHSHFRHRPGVVYLPPAYFGPGRSKLPVLVLMVGAPGTPMNWVRAGAATKTADAYATAHRGVSPVLVIVDQNGSATGDTECVDGPHGNAETYMTVDVPAFITGTLGIEHDAARWGLVGFSEGGTCALDLMLGHPDVYRHLVDLGGDAAPNLGDRQHTLTDLFGNSVAAQRAHDMAQLLRTHHLAGTTAWLSAGIHDPGRLAIARQIASATAKVGVISHEFAGIAGHNWQFARDAFSRILPPLCDEMGCTSSTMKAYTSFSS